MNDIFNIAISGSYGGFNLGDEAILQSIITQLRSSVPEVKITVFSKDPEDTLKRHNTDHVIDVRKLNANEVKSEIEKVDLFILGGGGILYDAHAKLYLREVIVARENNIPVMTYAIGAGPLETQAAQDLVRDTLNNVDVITVRERSAQTLLESIGVKKEITVTADPALLLQPEPLPDDLPIKELLQEKQKLVAMSVREPGVAAPDINQEQYHSLLADAADYIVDRLHAKVVFIPMERNKKDVQHSHAILSQMLKPQNAWVLKGDYSPGQMLSIIGNFDFAIGMRLHFLIFAAIQRVPFVALPYSSKVAGFLEDLDIIMPPIQLVNAGRLIAHIDHFWDVKYELISKLDELLPIAQQKALETNTLLLKLIDKTKKDR
ncbi:MAG: polysaccharide pyruvyl transferase family protein [Desulforhopalus sp.]